MQTTTNLPAVNPLLGRQFSTWQERKDEDRRKREELAADWRGALDTTVDIDPTQAWLGNVDRRHGERRRFQKDSPAMTGFGDVPSA